MKVDVGKFSLGNDKPFALIAGPCVIESEDLVYTIAESLKSVTDKMNIPYVFKASYDKANRSDHTSYRGPGIDKGLKILENVKNKFNVPVLTDVHTIDEARAASAVVDIVQIPAFLCRQTDFVINVAKTGKVINVKKAQFLSPHEVPNIVRKIESTENKNILLTERGVSFGYNNLVTDIRSLVIMKDTGYPVIFDATHSVQEPGGLGNKSGGNRRYAYPLAKAALSVGISGLFIETHPDPDNALSDGPNMIKLDELCKMLTVFKKIDELIKNES